MLAYLAIGIYMSTSCIMQTESYLVKYSEQRSWQTTKLFPWYEQRRRSRPALTSLLSLCNLYREQSTRPQCCHRTVICCKSAHWYVFVNILNTVFSLSKLNSQLIFFSCYQNYSIWVSPPSSIVLIWFNKLILVTSSSKSPQISVLVSSCLFDRFIIVISNGIFLTKCIVPWYIVTL